jgi:conjugal transfer/entry exclusion protein
LSVNNKFASVYSQKTELQSQINFSRLLKNCNLLCFLIYDRARNSIFKIGGIFDKVGENYRKFKQLLGEVLAEIGGIYYTFGKNSEQIGGEFRALIYDEQTNIHCKKLKFAL